MERAQPKWSKNRILLVEDDQALTETLARILRQKGLQVKVAYNGAEAQSVLSLEDFDLIVSDIRMPKLNGIQLLHFVKRNKNIPVVLMTGFAEIGEAKEAYELGAVGFLPKPFKQKDLWQIVEKALGVEEGVAELEDSDDNYSGLRIEEFVAGKEVAFDLFLRITEKRYVKVASGGESIDLARVIKYKDKGLTHLYLRREDFRRYLGFTVELAKKVVDSERIEAKRKLQFLTQTGMGLMKDAYREDLDPAIFQMATEMVSSTIELAGEQDEALQLFEALQSHSDHLYRHSLAVSVYSVLLAKAVGWSSPRTIMRIGLCGLLHDIGKRELPPALLEKPRIRMSVEEVQLLESHALRGMQLLTSVPGLPEEVSMVAMQHHEDCKSLGYPLRLSKSKIAPISRLVAVANAFCELVFPSPGQAGMKPAEAIARLVDGNSGRYDEQFLEALRKIFSVGSEKPRPVEGSG